jgi:hypothetical protein
MAKPPGDFLIDLLRTPGLVGCFEKDFQHALRGQPNFAADPNAFGGSFLAQDFGHLIIQHFNLAWV